MSDSTATILLTGATGFVGDNLWPHVARHGRRVVGLTRDVEEARARWPDREFVAGDLAERESIERALDGADAAFYLVHAMGGGDGFRQREARQARAFLAAAEATGVERIVYLGGIAPAGEPSEHLASRLEVGEILRGGRVSTVELRASMLIGDGSISWQIVRDLAARLPAMVLPDWTRSKTEPVAARDALYALRRALDLPLEGSDWWDIPGPEALTVREIFERAAVAMGRAKPLTLEVPDLFPELSVEWLRLVTDADPEVAAELVLGLEQDILASAKTFWSEIGHRDLLGFDQAAKKALADGDSAEDRPDGGLWREVEQLLDAVL